MPPRTFLAQHGDSARDGAGNAQQDMNANHCQKDWISRRYLDSRYVGRSCGHADAFRDVGGINPSFPIVGTNWLHCTDERAHEFAVDLLGNRVYINALTSEEFTCVGYSVDPSGFDADILEACGLQLRSVFALLKGTGDTADPKLHPLPKLLGHLPSRHDIGNRKTTTGLQYPKRFTENLILVGR